MTRIAPVPENVTEPAELVAAIRARRGGGLLMLDRLLLHAPELAQGWNTMAGAVRTRLGIPGRLRELAIIAVGILNGADFEVAAHSTVFFAEGGTAEELAALRAQLAGGATLPQPDRAIAELARQMTQKVQVEDAAFAAAREALGSDKAMVEMIGTIAFYNTVSRFLVALRID